MSLVVPQVPEAFRRPLWMSPVGLRPDAPALRAADKNDPQGVSNCRDCFGAVVRAEGAGAEIFRAQIVSDT